jgi:hypothetical protein
MPRSILRKLYALTKPLLYRISIAGPLLGHTYRCIRAVVRPGLVDFGIIEVASPEQARPDYSENESYLALRLIPKQGLVNGGMRSELSINYPFQIGDTVEYTWQFRLPADFPSDPLNRWWIVAQWHDQPDPRKGETWANHPPECPPFFLMYRRHEGSDRLALWYRVPARSDKWAVGEWVIPRGTWITISATIHWSRSENGSIVLQTDAPDCPALYSIGPNMLNDYQHWIVIGNYRHPDIQSDATVHVRRLDAFTK